MKISLISVAVAAAIVAWAPVSFARQAVAIPAGTPGVVGAEGELNGVDTTGKGTLTIADGQNINTNNDLGGAFTTANGGDGTLLFLGDSTVTGSTGMTGKLFLNIDAGALDKTTTFNGDVFSKTVLVREGTVNFNGNVESAPVFAGDGFINLGANKLLTGAITTNTANTGTLTLNNGSNVDGAIGGANGLKQINVVGGDASITGSVQAQNFSLGANTLAITGALTTNAAGTIETTLAGNAVYGNIKPSGSSNISAAGITVIPVVKGVLTAGTTFTIVGGKSGTQGATVTVLNNNPLYTFSAVPTTTGDVLITVERVSSGSAVADTTADSVLATPAAEGSDFKNFQDKVSSSATAAEAQKILLEVNPSSTSLAAPWVAGQATRQLEGLLSARADEIQNLCGDTNKGPNEFQKARNCIDTEQPSNWWMKSFGSVGNQDAVDESKGYDSKAYGLMLAYDRPVSDDTRVGVSVGYVNSKLNGNDGLSNETNIDSYQLTGYFNYTPGPWYVQGALTAGIDQYDGERHIPGQGRVAKADYDGQQYSALVSTGKHFYFDQDVTVTPFASLKTSLVKVDGYTEHGANGLNHRVDDQDYNFTQSGLGVKVERVIQSGISTYSPEVHAKWSHDFDDTRTGQNVAFTGGGNAFSVDGIDRDREMYNVGAGLTFLSCNCTNNAWTLKGQYDYEWNDSEYSSNQLSLIASLKY